MPVLLKSGDSRRATLTPVVMDVIPVYVFIPTSNIPWCSGMTTLLPAIISVHQRYRNPILPTKILFIKDDFIVASALQELLSTN
jgi:hypothetical protein